MEKFPNGASSITVLDMSKRENFEITHTSSNDDDAGKKEKNGLAIALYYLLIKTAKIIKVYHLINDRNDLASRTSEFIEVLQISKQDIIGGAIYNTNNNRQEKLRRVDELPIQAELQKLKSFMCSRMKEMLSGPYDMWTVKEFVELRDIVCARLALFNARRGREPARLQLSAYEDGCKGDGFDRQRI